MPRLLYFADPMCSWCWGFAPVIQRLLEAQAFEIVPVMGGLRAGETRGMTPQMRQYILHHWQQVHETTGQTFQFDGALPDGFVYDTEPACRAVVAVRELAGNLAALQYLHALQQAFYAQGQNTADVSLLQQLAMAQGVDADVFARAWQGDAMRLKTAADFERKNQCGVMGFPCVIADTGERLRMITMGYQPYDILFQQLERRLGKITLH